MSRDFETSSLNDRLESCKHFNFLGDNRWCQLDDFLPLSQLSVETSSSTFQMRFDILWFAVPTFSISNSQSKAKFPIQFPPQTFSMNLKQFFLTFHFVRKKSNYKVFKNMTWLWSGAADSIYIQMALSLWIFLRDYEMFLWLAWSLTSPATPAFQIRRPILEKSNVCFM